MKAALRSAGSFVLPPDDAGSVRAFSRIGYDLAEALADLIDNSIDAAARRVEITFTRNDSRVTAVTIADNGRGLTEGELQEAMRFAGPKHRAPSTLGMFGLGMKSASLSQCRSVSVLAKSATGSPVGCRWTETSIREGWRCETLESADVRERFAASYASPQKPDAGLVVLWEQLDRLTTTGGEGGLDSFLQQMLVSLDRSLGLTFHRFIGPAFGIVLRVKHEERPTSLPRRVRAYDPFGYAASGRSGYPRTFETYMPGGPALRLHAHIWPSGSESPEFLLGKRRALSNQGFFFYRNDRLVQAGGWQSVTNDAVDPELTLARVAIDIPPEYIDINVQKSRIQTTAALSSALADAKSGQLMFGDYLDDARRAFRQARSKSAGPAPLPLVLGDGLPVSVQRQSRLYAGGSMFRRIDFVWHTLPPDRVFALDQASDRIVLNDVHRARLSPGSEEPSIDLPIFKTLLFFLLKEELDGSRLSQRRRRRLDEINNLLLRALENS
ncbi:ATP-binding protein [Antarcticirhabdus aurantiaca]|uniref:ATP-binding protein n=1 Tax=Antarcticirhabdus aurantiaca TaxID=2606717 RepID=A0ACD4NP36_9HYPH|nr:ATP-binding protein [Antarcticirhabdus aurantiaca]WAJ28502.1 ATP-binding protein [Jeongeuplla avenae]